jgi:Zn-dependent protease with chaperone function
VDIQRFEAMVARLERDSAVHPRAYLVRVAALALVGYALLAVLVGVAGFGLLVLAGIAIAALWTGGGALVLLLKLGKLLIFLAVPLWFLVKSAVSALFVRLPVPAGRELTRHESPALFAAIDAMRVRLRGPRVHHVLLVDDMNAAIVQRPLFGLIGVPRNYLMLGLPLLECMTPEEALAVVAHEYGHLAGSHGRFAAFIYRLRNTWGTIQDVASQWRGFVGGLLARVVAWYAPYFNAYSFVLARANEYQADRTAADLVGAAAAASALKRVNVAAAQHDAFFGDTLARVKDEPQPPADVASRWATNAVQWAPAAQRWLDDALDRKGRAMDTHPTLRQRLAALVPEAQAPSLPDAPTGATAAQTWLGAGLAGLRREFEVAWAQSIAQPWSERHEATLAQRARLAELKALVEPATHEQYETLQLQSQLEPELDLREPLAAFNAAHPEHVSGLFLEGSVRLERDDEAGVPLMEQVMARDADAIKPCCERLYQFHTKRRDDERAEAAAQRWRKRDELESERERQAGAPQASHALHSVPADDPDGAKVREALATIDRKGVARVYFVRRTLPADPEFKTFLVALELTWWARQRRQHQAIVDRFANAIESPAHLMVVTVAGDFASLRKPLKAVPGGRVG